MCHAFSRQLIYTSFQKQTHASIVSEKYFLILNIDFLPFHLIVFSCYWK